MARSSIHLLGVPATRSNTRKTSPLIWFENEWDLLEGGKKSRLYKGMCTDLVIHSHSVDARKNCLGLSHLLPRTTLSYTPPHTRLLLQPLLLLCCFPLRWRLPGRVCTVEEKEACLEPALPRTRTEAAIASVCISEYTWEGMKPAQ